jgi:putative phosphoesterase
MLTLGVIADTHVPDRARRLNPRVISVLRDAGAAAILHAGDICSPEVLRQLGEVAPVHAVMGNRDVWRLSHLPMKLSLDFKGITIGLTHGHGGLSGYFTQKLSYIIKGYQFTQYEKCLRMEFPTAQVVIFGHTHRSENTWSDDVLIFNPGPASKLRWGKVPPSIGLLHIQNDNKIRSEIVPLVVK